MPNPHHEWLRQLTSTPSAAGREQRVSAWVRQWVRQRRGLVLDADAFGNLTIRRKQAGQGRPIYFTAHIDHPSFVVHSVESPTEITAQFRGSVDESYFVGAAVKLFHKDAAPQRGKVAAVRPAPEETRHGGRWTTVTFPRRVAVEPGDIMTWDIKPATIRKGMLHAPGCDDLAGVAAALAAYDSLPLRLTQEVRVLLTRAEEMAFIGAIAAAREGAIPRDALLICLENSRSYAESPIGAGPIVRVGDRTSTFDPDLTYRVARVAEQLAKQDSDFRWQRKLMPGGTCEASAFQSYGYTATCVCLPLGNYHNQNEQAGRIDAEFISVSDFDHLVHLLTFAATTLSDQGKSPALRDRLESLYAERRYLLEPPVFG